MDNTINNNFRSQQPSTVDSVVVPKGANLLRNANLDRLEKALGDNVPPYSKPAYDPALVLPKPVDKNAPMQNNEPSEAQLTSEYEAAVIAGIKEKVTDQAQANKLIQSFLTKTDSALKNETILGQIMQENKEQINAAHKRNRDDPIPRSKDKMNESGRVYKEGEVKALMQKYPDLFANGKLTDKGYQTLRAIMTGNTKGDPQAEAINQAAIASLGVDPEIDADAFNAKIGMEFEAAFKEQIADLSPQDQRRMEYMFNMDPNNPEVKGFIDKAAALMQAKWGGDVPLITENLTFTISINGEYQLTLDETIKKMGPQLTKNDIASIKNYLIAQQKGEAFEISAPLKAIADKANAAALADVQLLYGVPKSWVPDSSMTLSSIFSSKQAQAYLALNDQVIATQIRLDTLPPSPEKNKVAELLKIISQALSDLKAMLFETASADAAVSSEMSRAQISLVHDKALKAKAVAAAQKKELEAAQAANDKAAEQAEKNKIMGPLMIAVGALLTLVSIVVTAVTFGATAGLIALAIAVVIICLTYIPSGLTDDKGNSKSCMSAMFEGINQAIDWVATGGTGDPTALAVVGTLLRTTLIVGAIVGGALSGQMTLLAPLIITFIMESGFIQKMMDDIVKASGADAPPEWLATLINGVLMVTVIIACIAAKSSSGAKFAKWDKALHLTKVSNALKAGEAARGGGNAISFATKMRIFNLSTATVSTAMSATASILQAQNEFAMADLKKLLAKAVRDTTSAEAKMEAIEAMIKMLQKVIDSMFGQITEFTEWAKTTGEQMDQKWADKTELMSDLHSAS